MLVSYFSSRFLAMSQGLRMIYLEKKKNSNCVFPPSYKTGKTIYFPSMLIILTLLILCLQSMHNRPTAKDAVSVIDY